jgi:hypothetical protein
MSLAHFEIQEENIDTHFEWAELKLKGLREEHQSDCDGSERCLVCRYLARDEIPGRLGLASFEYRTKVAIFDPRQDGILCIYCGSLSEHRDHLLPRGWTGEGIRRVVPTVPACADCNKYISDFPEPLIVARAHVVADKLRKKMGKLLFARDRSEEEFAEFGEKMRQTLMAAQFRRQANRVRLHVLDLGGLPEVPKPMIQQLTEGNYENFIRMNEGL